MPDDPLTERIKAEATKAARFFNRVTFDQCIPLAIDFPDLPHSPGIYAIKSSNGEILYIGQSTNVWVRFNKGHSTLLKILISGYSAEDLKIAVVTIAPALIPYLKAIEDRVIVVFQPPYNKYIPSLGF